MVHIVSQIRYQKGASILAEVSSLYLHCFNITKKIHFVSYINKKTTPDIALLDILYTLILQQKSLSSQHYKSCILIGLADFEIPLLDTPRTLIGLCDFDNDLLDRRSMLIGQHYPGRCLLHMVCSSTVLRCLCRSLGHKVNTWSVRFVEHKILPCKAYMPHHFCRIPLGCLK